LGIALGKGSSSPDPYQTASAQASANTDAIKTAAKYSAVDQNAPWGSTTYQRDAQGVPTSQNISLGPAERGIYDTTNVGRTSLANRASSMAGQLPNGLFAAPDASRSDAVEKALYDRKLSMIQPDLDQADKQMAVTLSERGIPIGSEVYRNEMDRLARNRSNTLSGIAQDATLAGGQEQDRILQNAITTRNQGYNELGTLMAGAGGGQMPTFAQTPAYSAQAPNVSDMIYKSAAANQNQNNSLLNGLFGLGAAAIPFLSDRRAKKDIKRVGTTDAGLPVYTYRYKMGGPMQMGVMADEVEAIFPEAVHTMKDGLKAVDYAMVA